MGKRFAERKLESNIKKGVKVEKFLGKKEETTKKAKTVKKKAAAPKKSLIENLAERNLAQSIKTEFKKK